MIYVPPHAVLFDFNGTVSDDETLLFAITAGLLADAGAPIDEARYRTELAGLSDREVADRVLGPDHPEANAFPARRVARYRALAGDGHTVAPHAREAVRWLAHRTRLAVVSGAYRIEVEDVLRAAGIRRCISVVVAVDDVPAAKPSPDGYRFALDLLGVDPSCAVAVEDTPAGIAAARGAGLRCVGVRGTVPDALLDAASGHCDRVDMHLAMRLMAGLILPCDPTSRGVAPALPLSDRPATPNGTRLRDRAADRSQRS